MSEMNEEKITKCLDVLARIDSNPEQLRRDLERTRQQILEEIARSQAHPDNLWRKVMKSNLTKFAIAAIVMLAAVAGFFWMGDGAKLAWAEVAARVEQAGAFSYRMLIQMEGGAVAGMPGGMPEMEGHILISPEFGMKGEMSTAGKVMQIMYVSAAEKGAVMLMPEAKKIMRMQFSEDLLAKMQQQNNDPRYMFSQMMNCEYTELGRQVINGVEAEGIRTTDPKYGMGMFQEVSVEIWADVERGWPVLMEMDAVMNSPAGGGLMNMHMVMEDFQWNLEVTAADFTPKIPEDYTAMPDMQMPAMNAEAAIEGLQFYADILDRYPKKLDLMNITAEFAKLLAQQEKTEVGSKLGMDVEGLSEQEQAEKLMPQMMKIQGIAMFYMAMTQEGRDPKYYGAVVEPGDAEAILLGWRRDDGQYDVIYGDLSRGTIAAEEMPEEPVIPEDDTVTPENSSAISESNLPPLFDTPQSAIDGLRFFSESTGRYPEKLDIKPILMVIAKTNHDQNKANQDNKPLLGLIAFYRGLDHQNKDPRYYGTVVKPGDADAILLGWRRDDGQYDVIYGDLSRGTVAAEEMPEEPIIPEEPNTEVPDNLTPPSPPEPAPVETVPVSSN